MWVNRGSGSIWLVIDDAMDAFESCLQVAMTMLKKLSHQFNVCANIQESNASRTILHLFRIVAPYSSNIFNQQPNYYPEHGSSVTVSTIPPGISKVARHCCHRSFSLSIDAVECQSCSRNARCEHQGNGYCCRCLFPYLGSGLRCERAGKTAGCSRPFYYCFFLSMQTENYPVVGNINGTINGQQIDAQLQGYAYIEDGRIHNSLYNMPFIYSNFQQLSPLFNTITWLFGTIHRFSDPIENGFALTGRGERDPSKEFYDDLFRGCRQSFGHRSSSRSG